MNNFIKAEWVAALRSKEYQQGGDSLKDAAGALCVLGVLCELYAEQHGVPWVEDANGIFDTSFLGETEVLPKEVSEWAELDSNPDLGGTLVVDLNDYDKLTFKEFAVLIEDKL